MMRTRKTRVAGKALALGLLLILLAVFSGAATRSAGAADGLSLQRTDYPFGDPAVADNAQWLALADLNSDDGDLDAITANFGSGTVSVLPNQGDGTFGPSTQKAACSGARDLVVGNLDSNSVGSTPDALIQCSSVSPVTLLGDGNGGFADPLPVGTSFSAGEMALGHMNTATGGLDVIFKGFAQNNQRILCHATGDGDGTFTSRGCAANPQTSFFAPVSFAGEMALADLHDDGLNGAIAFNTNRDKVLFFGDYDLANHPFTGFSPNPSERSTGAAGGRSLSPGDIDNDGDTDLVVGNARTATEGSISVFIWGENGFDPAVMPEVYPSVGITDTALGDINDDGNTDVIAVGEQRTLNEPPNLLAVHPGNGDGTFDPAVVFALPGSGVFDVSVSKIQVADLDGDGIDDAAVASSRFDLLSVFLGVSSQNEAPVATDDKYSTVEGGTLAIPDGPSDILFNDTDGDGDTLTVASPRPISGPTDGALTLNENGSFTYTPNAGFTGDDTFTYKATDGNAESNIATAAITVEAADGTPPNTTITSGPPPLTKSKSASFQFTSEPGATFECKRDSEAFSPCTSPKSYANLPSGPHTFQVRAKDAAGNTDPTPARRNWIVDAVKPTITALGPAPGSSTRSRTVGVRATVKDNRTNLAKSDIQLFVDGTKRTSFTYNQATNRLSFTASNIPLGRHTVRITATDAAGNAAVRVWSFRVVRR